MREGFDLGPVRRVYQVVAYLAGNDANFLFGTDIRSITFRHRSILALPSALLSRHRQILRHRTSHVHRTRPTRHG
jgi:hypothetical protein